MATIDWPSTLPNPNANGFAINCKSFGNDSKFQSGRPRLARNRASTAEMGGAVGGVVLSLDLSFTMTFDEYSVFTGFHTSNWATLAPNYANLLNFTIGAYSLTGWPSSEISTVRRANSWTVSFGFEVSSWNAQSSGLSADETNPLCPSIPSRLLLSNGAAIAWVSGDEFESSESQRLSRIPGNRNEFRRCKFEFQVEGLEDAVLLVDWWARYLKFGAVPFKFDATRHNLGAIGDAPQDFYFGKFTSTPEISYQSVFGTASFTATIWLPDPGTIWRYKFDTDWLDYELVADDEEILDSADLLLGGDIEILDGRGL